jgi:hypothetical protein
MRVIQEALPKNPLGKGLKNFPLIRDQGSRVAAEEGGENPKGKTTAGYVPGYVHLSPKNKKRPNLLTVQQGKAVAFTGTPEEVEETFYAGCWVIAVVKPYVYGHKSTAGSPGTSIELQTVLKLLDDDAFGASSVDPETAFKGVELDSDFDITALMG